MPSEPQPNNEFPDPLATRDKGAARASKATILHGSSCKPKLIVISPIYNEGAVVSELHHRLASQFDILSAKFECRACLVDDGSSDDSLSRIHAISLSDNRFGYISFSRNFGHQTAILAGLKETEADLYVVMDSDLQDPPEIIPDLIARWSEGFEVVYCVRRKRKEGVFKKAAYALFYRTLKRLSYLDIPLDTGDFCLMDKRVVRELKRLNEHNQFIRGLRTWVGFRQTSFEYERAKRFGGEPKYSFSKLMKLAYDGIFSFSFVPLKLVVNFGFMVSAVAFVFMGWIIYQKLFLGIPLQGWASLAVLILFLGGIQLLTIGVLGEYIGRIFDEVKARPLYVIKDASNLAGAPSVSTPTTSPAYETRR